MFKKFIYGVTGAILFSVCSLSASADSATLDSDGYPMVYLRGGFNNTGWRADNAYKFSRSGDVYTLVINSSNAIGECEFKIADDQWDLCNLGGGLEINSSQVVDLIYDSQYNLKTKGLRDAVISFTYQPNGNAKVKFIIDGVAIPGEEEPNPDPADVPDVYLRGNFNNTNWGVDSRYKFSYDKSTQYYTLNITDSNPINAGASFKIGSQDWSLVDLGGSEDGIKIDNTQSLSLKRSGSNLSTTNGIYDGSISFKYTGNIYEVTSVRFVITGTDEIDNPVKGLSGSLPVLYINVYTDDSHSSFNDEVISKDLDHKNYFDFAEYWLDTNGCKWLEDLGAKNIGSKEEPLALQIKARGNWTRKGFSKKPFKLKLDKKQSLLGMSKSKHYAILAHADDTKGYLRNFTGFNLGKRIGLPWTPWQQPVEVVINGDYRGLYFLTESIRVDEDRVNIKELGDNVDDKSLVSGGYIVELDNYDEDDSAQIRMQEKSCVNNQQLDMLRITFDTPEVYSDLQRLFITDQFSAMNNYVGSNSDELWKYIDLDDAAKYYLVEEIVSHTESFHGSTYLFRDYGENQKWHFSPLWDFGNAFNGSTNDFFYNCDPFGNTWIPSMRENKKFNQKVKDTWLWFMSNEYSGIENDINEYVSRLTEAAKADYARWNGKPIPNGGQNVADNRDLTGKANEVKDHLNRKINWLKNQFGDYTTAVFAEPEKDDTPAAPLPDYLSTGIDSITDNDNGCDSSAEYFNLQGMKVNMPVKGEIYIKLVGKKATKVIIQ